MGLKTGFIPEIKKPLEVSMVDSSRGSFDERKNFQGVQPKKDFSKRIKKYNKAKERSSQMAFYLRSIGEIKLANDLESCANWMIFHNYYTIGEIRLVSANFCKKSFLDPLCAIRRGSKQLKAYLDRFRVIKEENVDLKASLVTLTVKNGTDLKERFETLMNGVKNLNQKRKDGLRNKGLKSEWCKVLGLVGSYEVTYSKKHGWHPHCHCIVLYKTELNQEKLSDEWKKITHDSFIVDVRSLKNPGQPEKDFIEVFKYAIKFSSMSLERNYEAYKVLKSRRLVFSSGLFWGVKVPKSNLDEPFNDLPYIKLFYKYFSVYGYSLVSSSPCTSTAFPLKDSAAC